MTTLIGSDEVGYGAWAGPLVVCAVAASPEWGIPGLNDSKELSPEERRAVYEALYGNVPMALARVDHADIDRYGVKPALLAAHAAALHQLLSLFPVADVIVDGVLPIPAVPQARCVPKADALFPVVMAASIIAKVNRDYLMQRYHLEYPHYGFDTNAGYGGNKKHAAGLDSHGVCPIHRRSYAPIRKLLEAT